MHTDLDTAYRILTFATPSCTLQTSSQRGKHYYLSYPTKLRSVKLAISWANGQITNINKMDGLK